MLKHASEPQATETWRSSLAQTRLDGDAIREVLARASELQSATTNTMTALEVEALAQDLGVSPLFVRQAIAERVAVGASSKPISSTAVSGIQGWFLSPLAPTSTPERRRGILAAIALPYALLAFILAQNQIYPSTALGCCLLAGYLGASTKQKSRGARYGAFLAILTATAEFWADAGRLSFAPNPPLVDAAFFCVAAIIGGLAGFAGGAFTQAAARSNTQR